jgi:aerotaxis receptor
MNPYILYPVVAVPVGGLLLLIIRLIFRDGLATRVFWAVVPLEIVVGYLAFWMGVERSPRAFVGAILMGMILSIAVLTWLYRGVVVRVREFASSVQASTAQLSATGKETATTAAEQSATVTEVSSTLGELTETSTAAAAFAKEVMGSSSRVLDQGELGVQAVENAGRILELVAQVTEIVEAIRDFAGQSNLLAVNARVEAAKAGDHGRGFAVVASEIRTLADQSKESAQRIFKAIAPAEEGRRSLEDASQRMRDLMVALTASADNARQIAATVGQQSAGIQQISEAMANVTEGGKASAAAAQQVEQAVDALQVVVNRLRTYIDGTPRN